MHARSRLRTVGSHVAAAAADDDDGGEAEAYIAVVEKQARRLILKYLRAFDAWQRQSNPRDPKDALLLAAKKVVVDAAANDAFPAAVAELSKVAPRPPELDAMHEVWTAVLNNLDNIHRKHVLDLPTRQKGGGKASSMTHGVKYRLYEMRNLPGCSPLRSYWQGTGGYGNPDVDVTDAEWAEYEGPSAANTPKHGRVIEECGGGGGGGGGGPTGVMHVDNGVMKWSVYVPESYDPALSYPLILAMHGGGGRGDDFLLSWLATARTAKAIVISPKSLGQTWGLMSDAQARQDATSVTIMMLQLSKTYTGLDAQRLLCTGMSDGGTFCYVLNQSLPAPIFAGMAAAAAFPVPLMMPDSDFKAFRGLPTLHVHGSLDWMFDVAQARLADDKASKALGDGWTFTELPDWTHASPASVNRDVIWPWFAALPPNGRGFDGDFAKVLQTLAPEMFEDERS